MKNKAIWIGLGAVLGVFAAEQLEWICAGAAGGAISGLF